MSSTNIEWCDAVWNPVIGCRRCAPGCANCYAVPMAGRVSGMHAGAVNKGLREADSQAPIGKYAGLTVIQPNGRRDWSGVVHCLPERLAEPLHWRKPRRVFVNSMSDLFYGDASDEAAAGQSGEDFTPVPFEFIDRVFAVMALCPQHTFILLTKRAGRMREYFCDRKFEDVIAELLRTSDDEAAHAPRTWLDSFRGVYSLTDHWKVNEGYIAKSDPPQAWPLPNVILGVSVSEQASADALIPDLLATPAKCRAVSYEPALGCVDFKRWLVADMRADGGGISRLNRLHWIIFGGESGPQARVCNVAWARAARDQCRSTEVPFFLKQLGSDPYVQIPTSKRDGEWLDQYLDSGVAHDFTGPCGDVECHFRLRDRKGGNEAEWPEDLRGCREWPVLA